MGSLSDAAIRALEPYVGTTVAGTCLGATAISLGKTRDELTVADLPTLEANMRRLLSAVAPTATIDAVLRALEEGVS